MDEPTLEEWSKDCRGDFVVWHNDDSERLGHGVLDGFSKLQRSLAAWLLGSVDPQAMETSRVYEAEKVQKVCAILKSASELEVFEGRKGVG